jgi:hypothetical protein
VARAAAAAAAAGFDSALVTRQTLVLMPLSNRSSVLSPQRS